MNPERLLTTMHRLQAHGLAKSYRTPAETVEAVRDVSLTLDAGEFVCLHGTSGSGKSTLLHLLAGLVRPDAGSIVVAGVDLVAGTEAQRAAVRRAEVGVVFQHDNLIAEFDAWENVALPLEVGGTPLAEARRQALEALDLVGLHDVSGRRPHELSGGQRQRVGIARALVGGRGVLLADEPTGALDSVSSRALFKLFAEIASSGTAVLVVSHDPECRSWASRTLEMLDGRIIDPTTEDGGW